ncbi:Uncharacterized protein APZ42_006155 [Daphnia magna]|uniref:Uncharacterized protein n=1 Tax=Daphnia magna TaxID=35525 RepID=A0A164G281_9CRUS|nr:Uncharacterized protein APZ42_006155 [Daphnia magna]
MGPKRSPNKKKSPKKITEKLKLETKDVKRFILCVKNHPVLYNTIILLCAGTTKSLPCLLQRPFPV